MLALNKRIQLSGVCYCTSNDTDKIKRNMTYIYHEDVELDIVNEEGKEEVSHSKGTWKDELRSKTLCFWLGVLGNTILFVIFFLDV